MGLLNPPSGIAGEVHPKVKDYLGQIYTAFTSLEGTTNSLGSAIRKAGAGLAIVPSTSAPSGLAPGSTLAAAPSPPALQVALGIGLSVSGNVNLVTGAIIIGAGPTEIISGPMGTITTVLHGNAAGAPAYGAVSLTTDVSGTLPIGNGGTNATTAAGARTSLGVAANGANADITSLTGLTTPLAVSEGGTGSGNAINGTYTPTLFKDANITTAVAAVCQWLCLGNMVIVSGKATITPTANNTYTELGMSLPIPSAFAANQQCGGTGSALSAAGPNQSALIGADTTNHRAVFSFGCTDTGAQDMFFSFTYQVI